MSLSFIAPLLELAQNEKVQSKIEEAAKLFFSSDTVTINLVPVLVGLGLLCLLLVPLFTLLNHTVADTTGYGPPVYGSHYESRYDREPDYKSDESYEEFPRSLMDSYKKDSSLSELTKRMQAVAGPTLSSLTNAATKLIQ